jgi:hypothetical protein
MQPKEGRQADHGDGKQMMPTRAFTPPDDWTLAWGTVGWSEDGGTFYELGSAQDDGAILVRVTLFRGRDPTKPLDATKAQGSEILCKLGSNFIQIPPRLSRVLVGSPEGMGKVPGGSVIILADNANPAVIGNLVDGEAGVVAALGVARVLLKKNGTIVLYTSDNNTITGNDVFLKMGPSTLTFISPWCTIECSPNGYFVKHGSGAQIRMGAINGLPAPLNVLASYAKLKAATCKVDGSSVLLGPDAPGQMFFPSIYSVDSIVGPAPTPPFAALMSALGAYTTAVDALLAAISAPFAAGPPPVAVMSLGSVIMTPLTAAVTAAATTLTAAMTVVSTGILSSTSVKDAP